MKKFFYMAVAAIAALSSCTNDEDVIIENGNGGNATVFTATIENAETRTSLDGTKVNWSNGDKIKVNGVTYITSSTTDEAEFKPAVSGVEAKALSGQYIAVYPSSIILDLTTSTVTLPATQTYDAYSISNVPMAAVGTSTALKFKNVCAVLAIKVASGTVKKIKVMADKNLSGDFILNPSNLSFTASTGSNSVVLDCGNGVTANNTTFYVAIPAQKYEYLQIYLSADGATYKEAMATKKAAGLGTLARNTIYDIDYQKNAVQLWADGPYFATVNLGETTETGRDHKYTMLSSDIVTSNWGSAWRMPSKAEYDPVESNCNYSYDSDNSGFNVSGKTSGYGSLFLPGVSAGRLIESTYWTSTPLSAYSIWVFEMRYSIQDESCYPSKGSNPSGNQFFIRPVLATPEETMVPSAPKLNIKVTSADITTLKSIKVVTDQYIDGDSKVLEYRVPADQQTPEADGTVYSIEIPAQTYAFYQIYLSADGETYKEAMASKEAAGLGILARNTTYDIDYEKNAVQLWADGPYFATVNLGETTETGRDHKYTMLSSDIVTSNWGSAWRMPTRAEYDPVESNCNYSYDSDNIGFNVSGKTDGYGSLFLPGEYKSVSKLTESEYWTSTPLGISICRFTIFYDHDLQSCYISRGSNPSGNQLFVRAVLATPAVAPVPSAPKLNIKVTSADIATLKSIKVVTDQNIDGESKEKVYEVPADQQTPEADGTVYSIEVPAQTYAFYQIYLSADGTTYKEAMASKKTVGPISVDVDIDYQKNAVQLWANGPYFATVNVGETTETGNTAGYVWGTTITDETTEKVYYGDYDLNHDTAYLIWGSAWRTPTSDEFDALCYSCNLTYSAEPWGFTITGRGDYSASHIFIAPDIDVDETDDFFYVFVWSSTIDEEYNNPYYLYLLGTKTGPVDSYSVGASYPRNCAYPTRAVLR